MWWVCVCRQPNLCFSCGRAEREDNPFNGRIKSGVYSAIAEVSHLRYCRAAVSGNLLAGPFNRLHQWKVEVKEEHEGYRHPQRQTGIHCALRAHYKAGWRFR